MRTTRHSFTVYPPNWRPHQKFYTRSTVFQAKKLACRLGSGTEVLRFTRRGGRNDDPARRNGIDVYLASSSTNDFEFEVV